MTAPDPTAGERVHWIGEYRNTLHGNGAGSKDMEHTSGDEDEVTCKLCLSLLARRDGCERMTPASPPAVAASTGASEDEPNVVQRIINAWDCCGTCAGGVLAAHDAATADRVRREAAEAVLRQMALDVRRSPSTRVGDLHPGEVWAAWLEGRADSIAREQAR